MIRGEHLLQQMYGTTKRASSFYKNQMLNYLNEHMKDFITSQEMMFIATADSEGNCDSSFRAGEAGFVRVIDETTLVYPEYRGNGVMASLGNILENPHIGLMFVDFFRNQIGLRVNGQAAIIDKEEIFSLNFNQQILNDLKEEYRAERWVKIKVDEAYIQCSKHIPMLKKVDMESDWGTDDPKKKGGDFFKVRQEVRRARN